MAAIVCPDAIHLKTSRVTADRFPLLKHRSLRNPSARKLIRRADAGRTCSQNKHLRTFTLRADTRRGPLPPAHGPFFKLRAFLFGFDHVQ